MFLLLNKNLERKIIYLISCFWGWNVLSKNERFRTNWF